MNEVIRIVPFSAATKRTLAGKSSFFTMLCIYTTAQMHFQNVLKLVALCMCKEKTHVRLLILRPSSLGRFGVPFQTRRAGGKCMCALIWDFFNLRIKICGHNAEFVNISLKYSKLNRTIYSARTESVWRRRRDSLHAVLICFTSFDSNL